MAGEERSSPSILSAGDLESYREHGFVRVEKAFPRELALALQDEIWTELAAEHGIQRDDPGTWRRLPRSPKRAKHSPLNEELATTRFTGAITALLGHDGWERPATWGGFNVFFPDEPRVRWDVPAQGWHWDAPPTTAGFLIFSFYGEVRPGGGGTLIVDGSPHLIESYYASLSPADRARPHRFHRKNLSRWDPWLEALTGRGEPVGNRIDAFMNRKSDVRGVPCRVIELTGEPGDAVFCNLGMLHCVAPNSSDQPRFMRVKFLFLE